MTACNLKIISISEYDIPENVDGWMWLGNNFRQCMRHS